MLFILEPSTIRSEGEFDLYGFNEERKRILVVPHSSSNVPFHQAGPRLPECSPLADGNTTRSSPEETTGGVSGSRYVTLFTLHICVPKSCPKCIDLPRGPRDRHGDQLNWSPELEIPDTNRGSSQSWGRTDTLEPIRRLGVTWTKE